MNDKHSIERLTSLCDAGVPFSAAVCIVTEEPTVLALSKKIKRHNGKPAARAEVSMVLNSYPGRVYGDIRDAISRKLRIKREDFDSLAKKYNNR